MACNFQTFFFFLTFELLKRKQVGKEVETSMKSQKSFIFLQVNHSANPLSCYSALPTLQGVRLGGCESDAGIPHVPSPRPQGIPSQGEEVKRARRT